MERRKEKHMNQSNEAYPINSDVVAGSGDGDNEEDILTIDKHNDGRCLARECMREAIIHTR